MRRPTPSRRIGSVAVLASLALFLLGSNYCVLSALGGDTRMGCLSLPTAAAVPACHGSAPAHEDGSDPAPASPSCCPQPVVTPVAPGVETSDHAAPSFAHALVAVSLTVAAPAIVDRHGHRPAPDGEPPTRLARAPVPARAPPLA